MRVESVRERAVMKKNSLWKRILSLAAAFSLCAACAPAALANADPSAPQGDTLAGAVTEPEDFVPEP